MTDNFFPLPESHFWHECDYCAATFDERRQGILAGGELSATWVRFNGRQLERNDDIPLQFCSVDCFNAAHAVTAGRGYAETDLPLKSKAV